MTRRATATWLASFAAMFLGCGSSAEPDAAAALDAASGPDAMAVPMDAPVGSDAPAENDVFVDHDAAVTPDDAPDLDASADACGGDGGAVCGGSGVLAPCEAAVPALDVTFTMTTTAAGTTTSAAVRARHFVSDGTLTEQRTREGMTLAGTPTDLVRIWRAIAASSQAIYTIAPATPHPMTLEPRARRDDRAVMSRFDGLATFPTYASAVLECLDATDPERCLSGGGTLLDARRDDVVDGQPCRVMNLGPASEGVTVCVPQSCEQRRTLYPLNLEGPGTSVTFASLAATTHGDTVVVEPSPCETVFSLVLCDHPDL